MNFPIHILLIDDNSDYCRKLEEMAKKYRQVVSSFNNQEEAMSGLSENRQLKAVILDGRCPLCIDQTGEPKSNDAFHAIREIEEIKQK